jgi:uncharacterized protein (DUF362 family)
VDRKIYPVDKGGGKSSGSKVVIAKDKNFIIPPGKGIDAAKVRHAIFSAVCNLTSSASPEDAWQKLFNPDDTVGIKVNCLAGRPLSPHPELVNAIIDGLVLAGIKEEKIIIWDRSNMDLERAGFTLRLRGQGVRCFGTDALTDGYEPDIETAGEVGSCFSKIVSRYCTALISVPVLKDHDLAGVTISLKNFYGAIHNPNKYHDSNCNPYVADLNTHPYIKNKLRLVLCDALLAQCHGGPSYKQEWAWQFNGILVSRDPVALDRIGTEIIEAKRKEMNLPSLKESKREPKYIFTAAERGLGEADINRIDYCAV